MRCATILLLLVAAVTSHAAPAVIQASRLSGAIVVDGDINEPAWQSATRIEDFVEFYQERERH